MQKSNQLVALDTEAREESIHQLAVGVHNYYVETGGYPASLAALTSAAGYEYLRATARTSQAMATVNNLVDTEFRFNRVVVYAQEPYATPLTDTEYLNSANNSCGTGAFATVTDWCGTSASRWWKHETREDISQSLANERNRLLRVLQKFNAWYNDDVTVSTTSGVMGNNYPNPSPATAAPLISLVTGFAQTATTCTGMYTWSRIPLDCTDLYSIWGTPTVYNYISAGHIVLVTKTPYTAADGTVIYVSTEESL